MYNSGDRCHAHKPDHIIKEAIPNNLCATWSKKDVTQEGRLGTNVNHSIGGLFEPGDPTYGDHAFSFHSIGQNDGAGNFKPWKAGEGEDEDEN
jgi:hypothetical protein